MNLPPMKHSQQGMALLVSLVFLLLLTLIGLSSMQSATLQEKMTSSVMQRNQSFQIAEAALRVGESAVQVEAYSLPVCTTTIQCAPPAESATLTVAGRNSTSGVTWVATAGGFYGVQNIGTTQDAVKLNTLPVTLYRVTAVAVVGNNQRSVVESIYAK
ncbi:MULTISPECIES: PilX N-terminal domain-containing pilus assembly protein [unclassified Pseudomonas]|uniref:pilus assembly PilX family protein n=1 Tax=unclassified Pseudomonas TaxID=196821 RepID=UPI000876C07B|nr:MULTISPECIES: PilX N-terminal domain-containing pilus assembly protein [unclassified Pseudomonas]SCZ46720.1 type IV pilus assembly protein PilX [Pseudomonas sp. NFACC44-2]SDA90226.1 type IV pilus assembly protein PilX [Pseudomonas sp. NFACC51]SEJ97863.1 type IV pilus assembly protein PilX [Pseudomonas sp. NFACC07-1]SFJ29362.1 type IV pilus assembly protein PilX [Pseudomonas sp. NFACC54]SFT28851.1 type IV pilus assembly protein PilX [Pseudomonas sp. NFACC48-1]